MRRPSATRDSGVSRRGVLRGAAGTLIAGSAATGSAAAQSGDDLGTWLSDVGNFTGVVDRRGEDAVEITVGANGNGGTFAFAPAAVRIDPGTTLRFSWASDNHNVVVEQQPGEAGWEGHEPLENTGFSFEAVLETTGVYQYYCRPHLGLGMKGAIIVGDVEVSVGASGGEETGGSFTWPGGEAGALVMGLLFGAAGLASVSVLGGEAYSAYRRAREAAPDELGPPEEAEPFRGVRTELDYEDFEPIGTASLIVAYFLVLAVLWGFMYFIEFLGNGPTVIG